MTPPVDFLDSLVQQAIQDLAERLSISVDQIELTEVRGVVWPNGSLGCPQPGMQYAEVLVPGYLILLKAGNGNYEYHAGKGTEVFFCENPTPPVPGEPGDI